MFKEAPISEILKDNTLTWMLKISAKHSESGDRRKCNSLINYGHPINEMIHSVTCVNGQCRLELAFPNELITGMMATYATEIENDYVPSKFHNEFSVLVVEPVPQVKPKGE